MTTFLSHWLWSSPSLSSMLRTKQHCLLSLIELGRLDTSHQGAFQGHSLSRIWILMVAGGLKERKENEKLKWI